MPMTTQELYPIYLAHSVVSTDSRRIEPGCIFFALRGDRFDGNAYALSALEAGAAYAVVDDASLPEHPQLLRVEDGLLALQELAALHRATLSLPVIAITGTNGKTTTKELAAAVLSRGYNLLYTEGNLNNHIGLPLTLLRMTREHQLVLVEMGASKPGDIEELCQIAQPNYGIITNIGKAHLEGFGSIEGVASTKGELYDWLREHEGKVIRREEDEWLTALGEGLPTVSYGSSSEATVQGRIVPHPSSRYLSLEWSVPALGMSAHRLDTHLVGDYNLSNVLAAIALGLFLDIKAEDIDAAIASYRPSNSRSQLIQTPHNVVVADAYNANPSSMHMALEAFAGSDAEHPRLYILGDMNELGTASDYAHREVLQWLASHLKEGEEAWLCGANFLRLRGELPLPASQVQAFADVEELRGYLAVHPATSRSVLVKGSNGVGLGKILPLL